jgi:acetylornithine deacetylase
MTLRPSERDVVSLLTSLVSIESINPSLVPGTSGESAIADHVARWLSSAGLEVDVQDALPGRPNVVARLPGRAGGRSLLLNAHMDTVGVAGMESPFEPTVHGDRLYGRGAYDMKGGLAAIMLAARALAGEGGAGGDLIVTAVADEEYASAGTQAVVERLTADAAIVTEPTALRICLAHKGFAWVAIETHGRAAHGSRPELGVDAIAHMGRVLGAVESLAARLAESAPHPLLGTGSVHASLIEGGQELSSYPECCRVQIERRTVPGENQDQVIEEIRALLAALRDHDSTFDAGCELLLWRDPFEVSRDEKIVRDLSASAAAVLGSPPAVYGDTPWMDAALLSRGGIPTAVFGPGGAGAHAAEEWVLISDVAACAEILARTALNFS